MGNRVKVGIVGTGNLVSISDFHVLGYSLCKDAEIAALYDVRYEWAVEWAKRKGLSCPVCRTYEELLGLVDAVSICTPNFTHVELAVNAVNAGKHILCEKPVSPTYEQGVEILKALEGRSLVNMTGFCYRDAPGIKYLKSVMDAGTLGQVYYYRELMSRGRLADASVPFEWRMDRKLSGPGALVDFGSHLVDTAEYLLGDAITELSAYKSTFIKERMRGEKMTPVENDDCAIINARTAGGTLVNLTGSRLGGIQHQIEVVGSGGIAVYDELNPLELKLSLKPINGAYPGPLKSSAVPESCMPPVWYDEEKSRFIGETARFVDAIVKSQAVMPDIKHGLRVQYILEAIERSSDENRPVKIENV